MNSLCPVCHLHEIDPTAPCDRCDVCYWAWLLDDLSDDDLREIADGPALDGYSDEQVAAERELVLRKVRRKVVN